MRVSVIDTTEKWKARAGGILPSMPTAALRITSRAPLPCRLWDPEPAVSDESHVWQTDTLVNYQPPFTSQLRFNVFSCRIPLTPRPRAIKGPLSLESYRPVNIRSRSARASFVYSTDSTKLPSVMESALKKIACTERLVASNPTPALYPKGITVLISSPPLAMTVTVPSAVDSK